MIDIRFAPIERWPKQPTPPASRRNAPFRAEYRKTLELLDYELGRVHARDLIIQVYVSREQIRLDGWLRNDARPTNPGVIVTFDKLGAAAPGRSNRLTISMPCDTYTDWKDNLRAIALTLESLRAIDRYGVTQHDEQYRGWQQLPAPETAPSGVSVDQAARFLARHSGVSLEALLSDRCSPALVQEAYRQAARRLHPDVPETGSEALFVHLCDMRKVLLGGGR